MTTLREKMKQEMTLIGLAPGTQNTYLRAVMKLHDYYQKSPGQLTEQEVKSYLLYLKQDKKLAPNTYNTQIYGLRFFYGTTLRRSLFIKLNLPTTKVTYKLPEMMIAVSVPHQNPRPDGSRYGLGILSLDIPHDGLVWWYTGVIDGYTSVFMWIPSKQLTIAAQANRIQDNNYGILMLGQEFINSLLKMVR